MFGTRRAASRVGVFVGTVDLGGEPGGRQRWGGKTDGVCLKEGHNARVWLILPAFERC